MNNEIHIIGGGVIGLFCAHFLSDANFKVTLYDRNLVGKESSWAGGGILSPLYPWHYPKAVNQLATISQQAYPEIVDRLHKDSDINPQWIQSGMLILDYQEQLAATHWLAQCSSEQGRIINNDTLYDLENKLNQNLDLQGAIYLSKVAQVRNPYLVDALRSSLVKRGVSINEHAAVSELIWENNKIRAIRVNNEIIDTERVVVATGAWTKQLLSTLRAVPDVRPIRGQMLLIKTDIPLIRHIILYKTRYLIPRQDGHVLVGSTMEDVGFDKSTTQEAYELLLDTAYTLIPELANYPVKKHWSGLRPGSKDQIPTISAYPGIQGLYINSGHFRYGVTMAPASAQLLTEQILGHTTHIDTESYSV